MIYTCLKEKINKFEQFALTLKYIMTESTDLDTVRHNYDKENNIKKLFENVEIDKIISNLEHVYIYIHADSRIEYNRIIWTN